MLEGAQLMIFMVLIKYYASAMLFHQFRGGSYACISYCRLSEVKYTQSGEVRIVDNEIYGK